MTSLAPTLGLATVVAVGLYVPAVGLPLPDGCIPTIAAASAAPSPSPSCGGDLRECLRKGAEMMEVNFVGTYVSAKNVSRCVEIFNSCIHGAASRGGNPAPATSGRQQERGGDTLPQRFGIGSEHFDYDCSTSGSTVSCTTTWKTAPPEVDSFSQEITGSLSGMTMTGAAVAKSRYHNSAGCNLESSDTHPISFTFSSDGTVMVHTDAYADQVNYECPSGAGTNIIDAPAMDFPAKWSAR